MEAMLFRNEAVQRRYDRVNRLAAIMDERVRFGRFRLPVGWDGVLNLIPVVGTLAAKGTAGYIVVEGARMGLPKRKVARMALNVGVDFVVGAIPVLGWVADFFLKANSRNVRIIRQHFAMG